MPESCIRAIESREDRALRVALGYAIATGVRGFSRRTRNSKKPLGEVLGEDIHLVDYMTDLRTNAHTVIPLNRLAGEIGEESKIEVHYRPGDGIVDFIVLDSDAHRERKIDSQLNRTGVLRRWNLSSIGVKDLEKRVEAVGEADPLFGKAIVSGDSMALLEAVDAKGRAADIFSSRPLHYAKKVAKSPHTYQALAGAGLAALVCTQGPEFAKWWNTWIQHGFGKWLYDLMSSQNALKIFESSGLKVTASWILGGGLARAAAYSAKLSGYYRQQREKRGLIGALAMSSVYVPGKVLDPKAVAGDALTGAFVSVLFPFVFGVMMKAGDLTSKLVDAGSTLISGHPITNTVLYNPNFSLPVQQPDGSVVQVPFKYTIDALVKSWWICFGPAFSGKKLLFPAKHAFQRYMEDSGGPFKTIYRPFIEAGRSFGRLRTAVKSEGASLDVAGRHLLSERDRFTAYMKDLWTRSYKDSKTREGVLRGDGTLKSYWFPTVHNTTGALPTPYVIPWSAAVAWTMPFWLSLYGILSGTKPKDIYQNNVSPRSYGIMTGKAAA